LILSGNILYGTANQGGTNGGGTVFAVNTNGTGFTTLYSFTGRSGSYPTITNSNGAYPVGGLILSGNTLYGTASSGGSSGNGTIFAVSTDGTGFTNLHTFTVGFGSYSGPGGPVATNTDGADPCGGLVLSGNTLYGTAVSGGSSANGTVFKVNTDGTGFTTLHSFTASSDYSLGNYSRYLYPTTNSDGAWPKAGLILSGNTLYGTTSSGGSSGGGTVFAVNTDGTCFATLCSFSAPPPGVGGGGGGAPGHSYRLKLI
jgi:uncharacterized repeat protein (TIGR03803 family)